MDPAALPVAVTGASGLIALASLAPDALTDFPPYPAMGWLFAGLQAQATLGVTAVILLIASRTTARGQHVIARLGWVAVPDSFGIAKDRLPKASGATSHTTQASSGRRSSDPLAGRRRAHAAGRNP